MRNIDIKFHGPKEIGFQDTDTLLTMFNFHKKGIAVAIFDIQCKGQSALLHLIRALSLTMSIFHIKGHNSGHF